MTTAAGQVLTGLKDVSGVHGSFMVAPDGAMVARDLAAMFTDELLDEVGPRLLRLGELFAAEGMDVKTYVLRFREHLLFVRGVRDGVLCVLSDVGVNLPALRMGTSLAVRRLGPMLDNPPELPDPPPSPPPPPPPSSPGLTIQYRGAVLNKDR
jgi:predicted regulator of Ras-like GTPase activity (Roadblock/LC7/MglB family)